MTFLTLYRFCLPPARIGITIFNWSRQNQILNCFCFEIIGSFIQIISVVYLERLQNTFLTFLKAIHLSFKLIPLLQRVEHRHFRNEVLSIKISKNVGVFPTLFLIVSSLLFEIPSIIYVRWNCNNMEDWGQRYVFLVFELCVAAAIKCEYQKESRSHMFGAEGNCTCLLLVKRSDRCKFSLEILEAGC